MSFRLLNRCWPSLRWRWWAALALRLPTRLSLRSSVAPLAVITPRRPYHCATGVTIDGPIDTNEAKAQANPKEKYAAALATYGEALGLWPKCATADVPHRRGISSANWSVTKT
jgi:hypothetical protein